MRRIKRGEFCGRAICKRRVEERREEERRWGQWQVLWLSFIRLKSKMTIFTQFVQWIFFFLPLFLFYASKILILSYNMLIFFVFFYFVLVFDFAFQLGGYFRDGPNAILYSDIWKIFVFLFIFLKGISFPLENTITPYTFVKKLLWRSFFRHLLNLYKFN